jgi:hypothetical protein
MRAVAFAISCLLILGFYGYVFTQLYREHKRFKALEQRLREHLNAMVPPGEVQSGPSKTAALPKIRGPVRKETLIHVGVAIGGLLGLFAEIGFLNRLVNSFH